MLVGWKIRWLTLTQSLNVCMVKLQIIRYYLTLKYTFSFLLIATYLHSFTYNSNLLYLLSIITNYTFVICIIWIILIFFSRNKEWRLVVVIMNVQVWFLLALLKENPRNNLGIDFFHYYAHAMINKDMKIWKYIAISCNFLM